MLTQEYCKKENIYFGKEGKDGEPAKLLNSKSAPRRFGTGATDSDVHTHVKEEMCEKDKLEKELGKTGNRGKSPFRGQRAKSLFVNQFRTSPAQKRRNEIRGVRGSKQILVGAREGEKGGLIYRQNTKTGKAGGS